MITESTVAAPPTNLDTDTIRLNRSITARNYWKKRLDGIVPQVYFRSYLPVDPGLMPVDGYVQQPDPALRDRLNTVAPSPQAKQVVLLAALGILIQKCHPVTEAIVFTPSYAATQNDPAVVPVRITADADAGFRELLGKLAPVVAEDFKYGYFPFQKSGLAAAGLLAEMPRTLLHMAALLPNRVDKEWKDSLLFSFGEDDTLTLSVIGSATPQSLLRQLANWYLGLLHNLLHQSAQPIRAIDMMNDAKRRQVLIAFNDTTAQYPPASPVVGLPDMETDPLLLLQRITTQPIHVIHCTPSLLAAFCAALKKQKDIQLPASLKQVLVSGEPLLYHHVQDFKEQVHDVIGTRLLYLYRLPNATMPLTHYEVDFENPLPYCIPIGKPAAHRQLYVLDQYGCPVDIGIPGELHIAGTDLAEDALICPEPGEAVFAHTPALPHAQLCKTGDIACWQDNGELLLLGRKNEQVQIGGYRIDTGRVGNLLKQYPGIEQCVVVCSVEEGKPFTAYYVSAENQDHEAIRHFLSAGLPLYLVPLFFVPLHALPLTKAGMPDRAALPNPAQNTTDEHTPPRTTTEHQLVRLWGAILNLEADKISTTKSFFLLGGNSILSIHLINQLEEHFSVEVPLRHVFEHNTIIQQAKLVSSSVAAKHAAIEKIEDRAWYPASPAQQRMYFQQTLNPGFTGYNICMALDIGAVSDTALLSRCFTDLVARHESLRTHFALVNGQVQQHIAEPFDFVVKEISTEKQEEDETVLAAFIQPFDLDKGPMLRVALWQKSAAQYILLIDIHHIIADGLSLNLLAHDFQQLFTGKPLDPLVLQYRDYAAWINMRKATTTTAAAYWRNQLSGKLPRLDLPVVRNRNKVDTFSASVVTLLIEGEQYNAIRRATAATNTSLFMYLLSIWYVLLYKVSGNRDMIAGTDVTGRTTAVLNNIIGTFVNLLPLRVQLDPEQSFTALLTEVKDILLSALQYQEFQFDDMIELAGEENRQAKNPIVDFHFSMANAFSNETDLQKLAFKPLEINRRLSTQYELKVEVKAEEKSLHIAFVYNDTLYDADTIALLQTYYAGILTAVLDHPEQTITDIDMETVS
jgi:acyl carrier protein/NRPS condensation-like uncharacterized protein